MIRTIYLLSLLMISAAPMADDAVPIEAGGYVGKYWSDGSGYLINRGEDWLQGDSWSFEVKQDQITDAPVAWVKRSAYGDFEHDGKVKKVKIQSKISLLLDLGHKDSELICVSGHDYPGYKAAVRIDKNPAADTNEKGCLRITPDLEKALRSGSELTIRGVNFPYKGADTQVISLDGYAEVVDFVRAKRQVTN